MGSTPVTKLQDTDDTLTSMVISLLVYCGNSESEVFRSDSHINQYIPFSFIARDLFYSVLTGCLK